MWCDARSGNAFFEDPLLMAKNTTEGSDQRANDNPGATKPFPLDKGASTRGSSIQGERQDAKGGPAGANQGGAPRGASRLEPSHQQRAARQARRDK